MGRGVEVLTKICTKCNETKSLTEFHKKKSGKYGVTSICKICTKKYRHNYYMSDKETHKTNSRNYYARNNEKYRQFKREYHIVNRGKISKNKQAYYASNPDKIRNLNHKRRARLLGVESGPKPTRDEMLKAQSGQCPDCGTTDGPWHVDHIMPISKGGNDTADNVRVICATCNRRKNNKHPDDWAAELGKLFL